MPKSISRAPLFQVPVLLLLTFCLEMASAQKLLPADKIKLEQREDSLKNLAADIILDSLTAGRMRSDSQFIRTLVRALQIKNSFYYPFQSVQGFQSYMPQTARSGSSRGI